MKVFLLLSMIMCHIIDDYYLQGLLAKFKQKEWWKENCPQELYQHDWLIALLEHAFSWTFMMLLPMHIYGLVHHTHLNMFVFLLNMLVHAYIDHAKANKFVINLCDDQILHIVQIIVSWAYYIGYFGL